MRPKHTTWKLILLRGIDHDSSSTCQYNIDSISRDKIVVCDYSSNKSSETIETPEGLSLWKKRFLFGSQFHSGGLHSRKDLWGINRATIRDAARPSSKPSGKDSQLTLSSLFWYSTSVVKHRYPWVQFRFILCSISSCFQFQLSCWLLFWNSFVVCIFLRHNT
jgi:hypothetical protein